MAEPVSIAAGVVGLTRTLYTITTEIHKFHDGVKVVNETMSELANSVQGLATIVESIRHVIESITAQYGSGDISTLWNKCGKSIEDCKRVCGQLNSLLLEIDKDCKFLPASRKQMRLNRSKDKIDVFRSHIHSYRDGLSVTLQAIQLWNQASQQRAAKQVLPNLTELNREVRRIANLLDTHIENTKASGSSQQQDTQVTGLNNLKDTVKAARRTISSASTLIESRHGSSRNKNEEVIVDLGVPPSKTRDFTIHKSECTPAVIPKLLNRMFCEDDPGKYDIWLVDRKTGEERLLGNHEQPLRVYDEWKRQGRQPMCALKYKNVI